METRQFGKTVTRVSALGFGALEIGWKQNAALLEAGLLRDEQFQEIRDRWCDVAPKTWIGQT